jgi:DNA-binding transcriptional regulator YhcF (GntR family)
MNQAVAMQQIQDGILELEINLNAKIVTVSGMQKVHQVSICSTSSAIHDLKQDVVVTKMLVCSVKQQSSSKCFMW